MLVLARKLNERVILRHKATGEEVTVVVVKADKSIRLGFQASRDWDIVRSEIDDANTADPDSSTM